jgi:hypothetical protein
MHRSLLFLGFLSVGLSLQAVQAQQVASTPPAPSSSPRDSSQLAVVVPMPPESGEAKTAPAPAKTPDATGKAEWVKLSGSVLNERNEPLAGATVYIKEAADVVSTNARGEFAVTVPQGLNTLVFSYAGYQEQQLKASNFLPVTVKLQPARRRSK